MPYVMMTFGVIPSFIILIFTYFLTMISLKLLLKVKKITKLQDYYKIALDTYDEFGGWFVKICITLNNIGTSCAYLIIFLDSSEKLLEEGLNLSSSSVYMSKYLRLGFATILIFPFIFSRSTKFL